MSKETAELNSQIALLLGYTQEKMQEGAYQNAVDNDPYFEVDRWLLIYDGDEAAWEHFPKQWADSTDAILKLISQSGPKGGLGVALRRIPGATPRYEAEIIDGAYFESAVPSIALAQAWLDWKSPDTDNEG